jgi:hypothetical protein
MGLDDGEEICGEGRYSVKVYDEQAKPLYYEDS